MTVSRRTEKLGRKNLEPMRGRHCWRQGRHVGSEKVGVQKMELVKTNLEISRQKLPLRRAQGMFFRAIKEGPRIRINDKIPVRLALNIVPC